MDKEKYYHELSDSLSALIAGEYDLIASLANSSALLFERLSGINWVGFYLSDGKELVLGPFQGKVACV
ncbi:GAF domain-containing protein, partial [Enterobacter cloacae complex sp.6700776]|uniref:GAF domain-containing protein n=1 Tax=Enterobacter cloacae complex sp.6700776 TaxID=3397179 RepID=UPI003AAAD70E